MSGANTSASKSLRLLLFRSKLLSELKWIFSSVERTKSYKKKKFNKSVKANHRLLLPQTNKALRVQIANVVAKHQQLLQASHSDEELFRNFLQRILTQVQLNDLREAVKGMRMNALDFIRCHVEDNEIPQVFEKLFADVSYEIFL